MQFSSLPNRDSLFSLLSLFVIFNTLRCASDIYFGISNKYRIFGPAGIYVFTIHAVPLEINQVFYGFVLCSGSYVSSSNFIVNLLSSGADFISTSVPCVFLLSTIFREYYRCTSPFLPRPLVRRNKAVKYILRQFCTIVCSLMKVLV